MTLNSFMPLFIISGAFAVIYLLFYFYRLSKKGYRNPLTQQLLRSPGETLRVQIEDLSLDIVFFLVMLIFLPTLMYSIYISQNYKGSPIFLIILGSIVFIFSLFKFWRKLKKRSALYLALDCELAIGQELNQLMIEGYSVYHDFPAEGFNIDHIVVGPKGVFAVETKGRSKPDKNLGTEEATVVYDGESLIFPNWAEKKPLDQAKRQAVWLNRWLSSAIGEPVSVYPVLALPGWFIERKKPADIFIFNGKIPQNLLKWKNDNALSETLIKRIVHQLEQSCRNVEPIGFKKKKK